MNKLLNIIANDLSIVQYFRESDNDFTYRVCYSALALWMLKLTSSRENGVVGISKQTQSLKIEELLLQYQEYFKLNPSFFAHDKNKEHTLSRHIRRVYEETGYLFSDENNHSVAANYGRTICATDGNLFFGNPESGYWMNGLGIYCPTAVNDVDLFEAMLRDTLTIDEYITVKYNPFVEPFAGGFGVGIALLEDSIIEQAIMNDLDIHLYHFWDAVLHQTEALINLVRETPITLDERMRQKQIYSNEESPPLLDGFSTLFLNRVNYSGVLFAGPLGGRNQNSAYPLGCRFNKNNIIERIQTVARFRDQIFLHHRDACELIIELLAEENNDLFFNIDPPYVIKGKSLYSEYYTEEDHRNLGDIIHEHLQNVPWIMTYDSCDLIREIYQDNLILEYGMFHSAHNRAQGRELVITNLPEDQFTWG